MPRHVYSVFGLRVVASGPLPGLPRLERADTGDVRVHVGTSPPALDEPLPFTQAPLYVSPHHDEDGEPVLTVHRRGGGRFRQFRYSDGITFLIDNAGSEVWTTWREPWTADDAATYLLGPILAFILRLRGITALHASAVAVDKGAIALVGPPGAGKSTVAATFARHGHPVLSDDVVALDDRAGRPIVQPGAPRIRLWPDSARALYGSTEALPRLTPTWEKRFLDLTQNGYRFQREPLPLVAIYLVAERRSHPALPRVERVSSAAGMMALVANTHANHLLDYGMRAQEFSCLARVVHSVPIRRLVPHEDPARLSNLCDVILEDSRARGAHV